MNRMFMFIKIIILSVGFILVVFLMTRLGNNEMSKGLAEIFGLPTSAPGGTRVATLMSPLNWCETRVQAVEWPANSLIIREVKMKWMAESAGGSRHMDTLLVEKWFSLHCTVNVEKVADTAGAVFQTYVTVKFIKGEPVTLMRSADGLFQWKNAVFRSSELENAIVELAAQAQHATGG